MRYYVIREWVTLKDNILKFHLVLSIRIILEEFA